MSSPANRPNVLFILTDQQRYDSLGCNGNPSVATPALDALAAEGVRFSAAYATQPVCSPCRSSLVTGLYPHTTTVIENNHILPDRFWTWPGALHEAGYATGYIGKWHLGTEPVPDYWDVWHGFNTGASHWMDEHQTRYRPDQEADWAIEFLRAHAGRPFLCWLSFYPPHPPLTAPQEEIEFYQGRVDHPIYHAMVRRIDRNIGRVLETLRALDLDRDTLVVFVSDHGHNFQFRWNQHQKRLCYDTAARVPLIVRWPDQLPAGHVRCHPLSLADLAPTIMALCGLDAPADLHGQSAAGLLRGDPSGWRESVVIENRPYRWDHPEHSEMQERCILDDRYKLILNTDRPPECYDRRMTPADNIDLFGQPATRSCVQRLARELTAWGERTDDPLCAALVERWL